MDSVKDTSQTATARGTEIACPAENGGPVANTTSLDFDLRRNHDRALNDCWNRIGVRGNRSCPELLRHTHCRNCAVFSAAARTLLDVPLPSEFLDLATEHIARPAQVAAECAAAADTQSAIVFRVRAEWFAIRTAVCLEIADVRPIHSLPHHRNGAVLGLANVRGALLICASLVAILGVTTQPETTPRQTRRSTSAQRLLVARGDGGTIVFLVDEVHGVERFHKRDLTEVPVTVAQGQATYTQALLSVHDKTIGLLDDRLLFSTVERSLK
jgi:chemotaxis-related protein WspD